MHSGGVCDLLVTEAVTLYMFVTSLCDLVTPKRFDWGAAALLKARVCRAS